MSSIIKRIKEQDNLTEEKRKQMFFSLLEKKARKEKKPINVILELTPDCTLNCVMCYMHVSGKEKVRRGHEYTTEEWISIGKQAIAAGAMQISFTGGEPFLRQDFREIYTELHKHGLILAILTNATLIDEHTMNWLNDRKPSSVSLSVYGASEQTYERVCGTGAGKYYPRVIRAIEMLNEADIRFTVKMPRLLDNRDDESIIADFCHKRNIRFQPYQFIDNPRDEIDRAALAHALDTDEFKEYLQREALINHEMYQVLLKNSEAYKNMSMKELIPNGIGCAAGASLCWITWYGVMRACAMLPFGEQRLSGSSDAFEHAWNDLIRACDEYPAMEECWTCTIAPVCRRCAASHYLDTGEFGKRSLRVCETALSRLEEADAIEQLGRM